MSVNGKSVHSLVRPDIQPSIGGDQRPEMPQAVERVTDVERFAGVTTKGMQSVVAFSTQYPNNWIRLSVCRRHDCRPGSVEPSAPSRVDDRRGAVANFQYGETTAGADTRDKPIPV